MRANRARINVGEVLRGNEGAKRPTDLAKTEPRSRPNGRRSVNRVLCAVRHLIISALEMNMKSYQEIGQ